MFQVLWYSYVVIASLSFLLVVYIAGAFVTSGRWAENSHSLPAYGAAQGPGITFATDAPGRIRILVVNGGGMLGMSDLVILSEIEERSGKQIYELFDFFAGSSTGAIVSTLLLMPQDATGRPMTAKKALETYETFATRVFSNSTLHRLKTGFGLFGPIFENAQRIQIAQQLFKEKTFSDLRRPAMFPAYSQQEEGIRLFRNWQPAESNLLVSSLLAAVTAAPAVFPFINLEGYSDETSFFGDAGVMLNAPGEVAYLQAREQLPNLREVIVVTIDTRNPLNIPDETTTHGGLMEWFIPLVKMAITGEAYVSNHILKAQSAFDDSAVDVNAFALVAKIEEGVSVYATDAQTVSTIMAAGRNFVSENGDIIDQAIAALEGKS